MLQANSIRLIPILQLSFDLTRLFVIAGVLLPVSLLFDVSWSRQNYVSGTESLEYETAEGERSS